MKHFMVQNPFLTLDSISSETVWNESPQADSSLPLSGLRLAVKDLFHMVGRPTSAGNPTWLATHPIPTKTASSVTALLDAGATFCGKTITDELAYSLNGQNIHYGTPSNPVTPNRLPGGSSSGSAVAVSSDLADIGLGTDTGGSIRVPASYNGLFGLRPTHGVIPSDNMVALAPSFDTVGWLTRDLETLARTAATLLKRKPSKAFNNILIAKNLIDQVAHVKELKSQLQTWREQGYFLKESSVVIDTKVWKTSETFRTLQGAEIWHEHGKWINDLKGLAEVDTSSVFAPDIQQRFDWCQTISSADIAAAKQQRQRFTDWLENEIEESVLIIPTTPGLAPLFDAPDDELAAYRNQLMDITAIAGLAGLPQLHLPVCTLHGAPCGLSLVGSKGTDLALIEFAKTLMESAS
ncbi:amidase [Marinomonas rhizomae]|uniref:Asp-tRNA(Asn)/Glu-tRNA(Gln) amidotransferase A subunit family amidase n=1 Tax=Marinomonas rhizomae TaxID=491948 RepID=A0A366IUI9_9GAMM|nr:amidase [Marinomonas rhizomae]RBP78237.1 Asp-tRNA(Asn)/Glu-tRNA(Gln) amidotransferase A subunit family amidase [Marinomonas rhizomae]RNF69813.1 amidase [Marinomonas rhizomae]